MLTDHWPMLGLRVRTDRLELRLPNNEELSELASLASRGLHRPDERPFLTPWPEEPAGRARELLQRHWQSLGAWKPADWSLDLAVFDRGQPVGVQSMAAEDFAIRREVITGSMLGLEHQGRGIGTEMRQAILHLAFAGLGATDATSMSFTDNPKPLAISRKLGYQPDGITRDPLNGQVVVSQRLRLTRDGWEATDRPPVTITGLEACLELFGLPRPQRR